MESRSLHICIVTGDFPAITETFITNKVLALKKRGHTITVIKNNNSGVNKSHASLVKQSGVEILSMPVILSVKDVIKSPGIFLQSFSFSRKKFKSKFKSLVQLTLLQKNKYDIIHFEFSGLAISYLAAMQKLKSKTVVSCRGTAEKVKPLTAESRKENLIRLFAIIDKIHCVSEDMASVIKRYGATQEQIFVNRPSIDAEYFKRKTSYKFSDESSILTIGRFTFQKGYLFGLMAVKQLKDEGVKFSWKIIGDGPQREELIYHINALQLTDQVILVGSKTVSEILEFYNHTDIFLLPSVYEGIANVTLEAMSMELPVVSTRSGGMEEVIEHNKNGLLCNVYDPSGMAHQLKSLINNLELCKELGTNARKTIIDKFTIQRQVDMFESAYNELVNSTS